MSCISAVFQPELYSELYSIFKQTNCRVSAKEQHENFCLLAARTNSFLLLFTPVISDVCIGQQMKLAGKTLGP